MLHEHFGQALIQENGTIVQDIECEKFRIDGGKACSYTISIGEGETVQQVLQILTVIGERSYAITYGSSPENFDKDSPVFETMLRSFNGTYSSGLSKQYRQDIKYAMTIVICTARVLFRTLGVWCHIDFRDAIRDLWIAEGVVHYIVIP